MKVKEKLKDSHVMYFNNMYLYTITIVYFYTNFTSWGDLIFHSL